MQRPSPVRTNSGITDPAAVDHLARLLAEQRQLEVQLDRLRIEAGPPGLTMEVLDGVADDVDLAQQLADDRVTVGVSRVMTDRQLQLELAIERAGSGLYGLCADCGDRISPDRLAYLNAVRCLPCQAVHERLGDAA